MIIVDDHVPSYERCPLHFLGMVKDGGKKITTISNNLPAGAKVWRNHLSWSSKINLAERQEKWSFVDWKLLAEYFQDKDDQKLRKRYSCLVSKLLWSLVRWRLLLRIQERSALIERVI